MGKKTILVTGGAGLIGSHLCGYLLDAGHEVLCVDNFLSSSRMGLKSLENRPGFVFIHHDVRNGFMMNVDEVYHLASPTSPLFMRQSPIETLRINQQGTVNVLELARRRNARVVLASSGDVYGSPRQPLQSENSWLAVNSFGSRYVVEEGKRSAEALGRAYASELMMHIRVARIFDTYGPGMLVGDPRVVAKFIVSALRGQDLVIYGNGLQTRCFCYVADLVRGLVQLMESGPDDGSPVNLGSNYEITISALAKKIIDITGSCSRMVHMSPYRDDVRHLTPDLSLARRTLGWEPSVNLEEGLKRTVEWFEEQLCEGNKIFPYMSWSESL